MAKVKNSFYFDNFSECAALAVSGAKFLQKIVNNYDSSRLNEYLEEMHTIEHSADVKKHEMLNVLLKAFITPIDREDIMQVSINIDELSDKIEDVLIRFYFNHIKTMREDAAEFVDIVVKSFEEVEKLMREFADFKHSKTMKEHIININSLEEEADKLYIKCMYNLRASGADALEVIAWNDIYTYLEKCADTAEHIADIVESVSLKNS